MLLYPGPVARGRRILYVQAVKYKQTVTPAEADNILRAARDTFARVPQVRSVSIGRVVRTNGPGYEYALVMEFDSLDDQWAYGASEIHRQWVKEHSDTQLEQHLMLTIDTMSLEK
jgi:hypothetical protein